MLEKLNMEVTIIQFNAVCTVHHIAIYIYIYIDKLDAQILVIRLYFPLDALRVSDYIIPSSGTTFYKKLVYAGICRYHTYGTGIHRHIPISYKTLLLMMD